MTDNKQVRLGIIGAGNMGGNHIRKIEAGEVPNAALTAICDVDASKLEKFDEKYERFTDSKELIRSGLVDAIIVATPHYDHTTIGIDALEQGLHLLVEKPIGVHKKDCERLINAFEQRPDASQAFAAMFNQRTDPRYIKVKKLIDQGELGEIRRVNWIITDWFRTDSYYASGGWRATWKGEGGGVLLNQCPHQLDLLCWLCGVPSQVDARCRFGQWHDIEVEDDVTALLNWENGATGVFITTTGEAPGTNRLEIVGDRGKIVIEGEGIRFTRNEVDMATQCRHAEGGFTKPDVWNVDIPTNGFGGQHAEIMRNFVAHILDPEKVALIAPAC